MIRSLLQRRPQTLLAILLFLPAVSNIYGEVPTYSEVEKVVYRIWEERFPVPLLDLGSNPGSRGVLAALHNGKRVYYYYFQAKVPILHREKDGSTEMKSDGKRPVTFWLRYRPYSDPIYDLTFAREDLLPGSYKKWIRMSR